MSSRNAALAITLLSLVASVSHAQAAPNHNAAVPRPGAPYVLHDGAIQIVTGLGMGGVIRELDKLFATTHPGVKFSVLQGDNYTSMAALTFDRSPVASLGSEYTRIGLGDNLKIAAEPVPIRIAHASLTPSTRTGLDVPVPALGVVVNPANPLTSLSLAELTRIFAIGAPAGDIATWEQAGVKGPLAGRAIQCFGPLASDEHASDDPQAGEFISTDKMSGLNMNHTYAGLEHYADVATRVREDPAAIGIVALNIPLDGLKILALNGIQPTATAIGQGRYPLDRYVYLYLRVGKGIPLDAFGKEYVRTALSPEGQRILAAEGAGYLPLDAAELAEEQAKLDR